MRIGKLSRPRGASGVLAVLLMVALSAVVAPTASQAATVAPADGIIPTYHRCENFGVAHRGYIAGQCVDFYEWNDGWTVTVQGRSLCQLATTHADVACVGIAQTTSMTYPGGNPIETAYCGKYNGHPYPACPADNLLIHSGGEDVLCGSVYQISVRTTVILPVSGDTVTSDTFGVSAVLC